MRMENSQRHVIALNLHWFTRDSNQISINILIFQKKNTPTLYFLFFEKTSLRLIGVEQKENNFSLLEKCEVGSQLCVKCSKYHMFGFFGIKDFKNVNLKNNCKMTWKFHNETSKFFFKLRVNNLFYNKNIFRLQNQFWLFS